MGPFFDLVEHSGKFDKTLVVPHKLPSEDQAHQGSQESEKLTQMEPRTPATSSASSRQLQGWLARLNDGDTEARSELIRRSCGRVQKLVRHMLKGFDRVRRFEDTDDVLQNVLDRKSVV